MLLDDLETQITSLLTSLQLDVPSDDIEYIARLIEEQDMEDEDKIEGVKGMLEPHTEGVDYSQVDEKVKGMVEHWKLIKEEEEAAAAAAEDEEGSEGSSDEDELKGDARQQANETLLSSLTPLELAAAQKRALLAQYGYVEDAAPVGDGPSGEGLRKREEEEEVRKRREAIDKALKEEGRRGRKKKKMKGEVDLMAPNLNSAKVQAKAQIAREAARSEAAMKKDRDKAALDKQRADQAKAKVDKQKKAAKQERRA